MNIKASAKIFKCFSDTESIQKKKEYIFFKEQEDRTLNTILFYSTAEWAEKTDETSKLEEHVLSEKLSIPEETSFDQVLYWENEAKVTATPPSSSSTNTNQDRTGSIVYKNFFSSRDGLLQSELKLFMQIRLQTKAKCILCCFYGVIQFRKFQTS